MGGPAPGLRGVLVVWLLYAIVTAAIFGTYAVMAPHELYHVHRGGIAGGASFDVRAVDRDTVRVIGIKPKDFKTDYNFSPVVGALLGRTVVGDCAAQVPDTYLDLLMKVDSLELAKAIEQVVGRPLRDGETVAITISGRLKRENGATPFVGEDLVVVYRPAGRRP